MPTFFEKKQLVTPGDLLAEGDYIAGENAYMEGNKIYAQRIGLADAENKKVNVVALRAFYVPKPGDMVIGLCIFIRFRFFLCSTIAERKGYVQLVVQYVPQARGLAACPAHHCRRPA